MVERRAGAILNVASLAAFQPVPGMATYAATKAFVQSFSEALHAELAGTGVSCTVLAPGPVPTEFGEVAGTDGTSSRSCPASSREAPEEVAAPAVARHAPRPALGRPRDCRRRRSPTGGRYVPRSVLLPAARRGAGAAATRADPALRRVGRGEQLARDAVGRVAPSRRAGGARAARGGRTAARRAPTSRRSRRAR